MTSLPEHPASMPEIETFEYQDAGCAPAGGDITSSGSQQPAFRRSSKREVEQGLAQARAEGVREGMQQAGQSFEGELQAERGRIADAVRHFSEQQTKYYSRVEVELVQLALGIASKILHREAQVDRMLVAGLVKVALEKIRQDTRVIVRVHPQEVADWNHYFHQRLESEAALTVQGDAAIAPHNCVLETELGSTELGLDAQLKEIEQGFFDLLAQRPSNE